MLPEGWSTRVPGDGDIGALTALLSANRRSGSSPVDVATLTALVVGPASWTRRQLVVVDPAGTLVGWAVVHDRANGRTEVTVLVAPDAPAQDAIAAGLFGWADREAAEVAALRRAPRTQLDSAAESDDQRQRGWLAAAGYTCVRTWLHMVRPVGADEVEPDVLPVARPGVRVRRVAEHANGLPTAEDLQTVHLVLEQSFADHFNSYREGFAEFVVRLQEDPWHRWDHWWIAEVELEGEWRPGGALISSVSPPDASGAYGSYVDYIGVHRRARGSRGRQGPALHRDRRRGPARPQPGVARGRRRLLDQRRRALPLARLDGGPPDRVVAPLRGRGHPGVRRGGRRSW